MITPSLFEIVEVESEHDFKEKLEALFHEDFIDNVNKDFLKYKLTKEMDITKENKTSFKKFTYLIMFYNELILNINAKFTYEKSEFIKYRINTCEKLYIKSIQTCIDMLSLFEKGALTNSFLLWRSIYNDYVTAKFLSQSGENVSECYNEYSKVQKYLVLKDTDSISDDELKLLKQKYGNNFNNSFGWAVNIKGPRNFNSIRKKINETKYLEEYKFASMYHHSSSFSVNNSIFYGDENHGNANMLGLFSKNIEIPYNLTVSLMKDFSDVMIEIFLNDERGKLLLVFNTLLENRFLIQK